MRLHIFVEGSSEAAFMREWFPQFLPQHTYKVIQHKGKGHLPKDLWSEPEPRHEGLLDQLPAKLRAYGRSLNSATDRVVVLVDVDDDNCVDLKQRLRNVLGTCSPAPVVLFRIAIEEFEAFYLGDKTAIRRAFPSAKLSRLNSYTPDTVCGAWELFHAVVEGLEDKPFWAERMGKVLHNNWTKNLSPSFGQFCRGLRQLAGEAPEERG